MTCTRSPARWHLGLLPLCISLGACAAQPANDSAALTTPVAAPAATPAAPVVTTATAAASNTLPLPSGSHRYRFKWDGQLEGDATRSLSCQQSLCTLRTEASVPGIASLTESSRFQWQDGRVHFEDYQRNLQVLFMPQTVRISRQPDGQITTERKGKTRSYAGNPELIDTLSLEAQLRADLVRGGTLRSHYTLAEVKGPVDMTLEELPHEKLTIAGRDIDTRVFRRRSADGSRETTLWLDPAQTFLPLQVIHKDDGNTYRLIWTGAGN